MPPYAVCRTLPWFPKNRASGLVWIGVLTLPTIGIHFIVIAVLYGQMQMNRVARLTTIGADAANGTYSIISGYMSGGIHRKWNVSHVQVQRLIAISVINNDRVIAIIREYEITIGRWINVSSARLKIITIMAVIIGIQGLGLAYMIITIHYERNPS
jgi:hypothetical protein